VVSSKSCLPGIRSASMPMGSTRTTRGHGFGGLRLLPSVSSGDEGVDRRDGSFRRSSRGHFAKDSGGLDTLERVAEISNSPIWLRRLRLMTTTR
jgi:hypothetical protein